MAYMGINRIEERDKVIEKQIDNIKRKNKQIKNLKKEVSNLKGTIVKLFLKAYLNNQIGNI